MTDKQKEAIEKLKETSKQCHNSKECWEKEDCPDCYVEVEDIFAIEIVLNLIQTQQAEIEHQKEKRENQKKELSILYEKQKEFNKLVNTVKSYKGQFERQQAELEKKDKQIEQYQNMLATNDMFNVLECEKKDKVIDKLATFVFMSRNLTYVDEKQFNARKREIIEQAEKQVVKEVKRR